MHRLQFGTQLCGLGSWGNEYVRQQRVQVVVCLYDVEPGFSSSTNQYREPVESSAQNESLFLLRTTGVTRK